MIKVLIAYDHDLLRAGLRRIVQDGSNLEVVAEATDSREAIQQIRKTSPDVAVIDTSMPGPDGLEVLRQVHHYFPQMPILILTMHEEEQNLVREFAAGAKGYLTKRSAPAQLLKAIRKLYGGGECHSDAAAESLALRMASGFRGRFPIDSLSNREIQVLRHLALGQTVREIAEAYNLSHKTVGTYRFRLLKKLNLRNNVEISRFAIQNRLVDL